MRSTPPWGLWIGVGSLMYVNLLDAMRITPAPDVSITSLNKQRLNIQLEPVFIVNKEVFCLTGVYWVSHVFLGE